MVTAAGAAPGAGAVRPLNRPRPLRVKTDAGGYPARIVLGREPLEVASVNDCWRIEDEWWRGDPVSRTYFEVLLADGRQVVLFWDHTGGAWFTQRHG